VSADRDRRVWQAIAALSAALAVGASVMAGYPELPSPAQMTYLACAVVLTLIAGVAASTNKKNANLWIPLN
jgi:peptidoglycan/LPS O-acetylase OafA/YrhL